MSENSIITCCPECNTRFSVTEGQLKIAAGKVRCGVCLQVFEAAKYEQTATPKIKKKKAQPTQANKAPLTATREPKRAASPTKATSKTAKISKKAPSLHIPIDKSHLSTPLSKPQKSGLYWLLSSTSICFLVVLLVFQIAWFKRVDFLNDPALRPLYKPFYELSKTPMPPRTAPELLSEYQLVLQPHQNNPSALRVSFLIANNADFSQPFPVIQLEFSDIKNRIVAQRHFTPAEYLNTALFPNMLIPPRQPVQIQLDILNPGRRGVSYQVKLLRNNKNG